LQESQHKKMMQASSLKAGQSEQYVQQTNDLTENMGKRE
jgi:hypothetical protein